MSAQAQQSAVINSLTRNYWTGVNPAATANQTVQGSQRITITGGNTNVFFSLTNLVTGVGSITFNPSSLANSGTTLLRFSMTGPVTAGVYPMTIAGITNDGVSLTNWIASADINMIVAPRWSNTGAGTTGLWSDGTKWSGGAAPLSTESVYMEHTAIGPWTNVVDSSRTIQDLAYLGDADDNGVALNVHTIISAGSTLSVLGANGFAVGRKAASGARPYYTFSGDSMIVSNNAANFSVVDSSANSTRFLTVNMASLTNLSVTVNRFGIADTSLLANSADGSQRVPFTLARSNQITALFVDDYSAQDFNTAIQYNRQSTGANNGGLATDSFYLGITNAFFADSIGVGRGGAVGSGSSAFSVFGYQMRFIVANQNSVSPTSAAYFRNVDGGRMSLLAVAVDSGTHGLGNNRGVVDLRGGKTDMQVDKIWVGRNRTNSGAGTDVLAGFYFNHGTVNANTVQVGYEQFTNAATVIGYLLVATNGTLVVNTNLVLGNTPSDVTGFESAAAAASGQVRVENGGTIMAKQISVGTFSTNDVITLNSGSKLVVSNTVASSAKKLTTLSSSGGALTLHINGANTLVFASNLVASASSPINIGSVSGLAGFPFPVTSTNIHVIAYDSATTPNNWAGGTAPSGISVAVANNAGNNSIDVTLTAGSAKRLLWQDYTGDHTWNNTSPNWLDLDTLQHTNFSTLDSVTFDDSVGFSTITVSEEVVPAQSGVGILVTNNLSAYVFTGPLAGKILGAASLVKTGTNTLTVDMYAESGVSLSQGELIVSAGGTVGSVVAVNGTTFNNGGLVLGLVSSSGLTTNAGIISTGLSLQSGATFFNAGAGTVGGSLSMSGASLVNSGLLNNTSISINNNATLSNAGTINTTGGLTVNAGGTLIDTVAGAIGAGAGSMNIGTTLTVNAGGTFKPGGNVIQTTKVTEYPAFSSQPAGGVFLTAGSTNIFLVDVANSQTSTLLLANNQRYGPNQQNRIINGCTLVINNIGATPFAAGQTFHLFEYYQGGGNIVSPTGANVTNTFPFIIPAEPGPGLRWVLSGLYPGGTIRVVSVDDPAYSVTLTNNVTVTPSNLVAQISWPAENQGGWLEQQVTSLTNGLGGAPWTFVSGSPTNTVLSVTNNINVGAVFYRFVYP